MLMKMLFISVEFFIEKTVINKPKQIKTAKNLL